jgi:hypothetical protein
LDNPWEKQSSVNPPRKPNRQVPNSVWLALIEASLSSGEYKVILTIIDRSWGYGGANSAEISLKRFETMTRLSRKGICKIVSSLEARHIIVVGRNGTHESTYLFNKHFDTWLASEPQYTSAEDELVNPSTPVLVNGSTPELGNHGTPEKCTPVHQSSEPEYTSASVLATSEIEPVKENNIKKPSIETIYKEIFTFWNSTNGVIKHKGLTDKMKAAMKTALKTYTQAEIHGAIWTYADICTGEQYWWTHRWTLEEFLRRGLEKFMDKTAAEENYRIKEGGKERRLAGRTPSGQDLDEQERRYFKNGK